MDQLRHGEDFIRLYNELDHVVKLATETKGSVPFWKRLRIAAKKMPAVRRNLDDLLEYHELRNAIVHHRSYPDELLAIPTTKTLDHFRSIVEEITLPAKVIPAFKRDIHVFGGSSQLHEALSYMKNQGFRQIVAWLDGELRLVTPNGISNWLLAHATQESVSLAGIRLEEMLQYEEPGSCRIVSSDETIDRVRELFDEASRKSPRKLYAVLITDSGASEKSPLGIITPRELLANQS